MIKKKILWVVYDFVQAGGQRYVYEITRALNKEKYSIDFLRVAPMNHNSDWCKEFYYESTINLGCNLYFLDDVISTGPIKQNIAKKLLKYLERKLTVASHSQQQRENELHKKKIANFFEQYDVINFSGVAVYGTCIQYELHQPNYFIHILTFGFQHEQMYQNYDRKLRYNFITPVTPQAARKDLEGFSDYNLTYFPLCFDTKRFDVVHSIPGVKSTIAVFTRLSPMKPLDPFFYTLKILREQGADVQLLVYGAGDPRALGITKQLDYLYLADHVKFMGHTEDIPNTLTSAPPDLIWFQSANKEPGGYAAFEIAMSAIPQLFWDFMDLGEQRAIADYFPSFTSLLKFAGETRLLLADVEKRKALGQMQRNYVITHYNVADHIHIIEELFDK